MKNYSAKDVNAYIAGADREARPKLKEIRKIIRATIPKVEEKISWGVPFYRFHGPFVGFASFKNHISFGLGLSGLKNKEREILGKKGYKTGSKIIQVRFDQKIPVKEIQRILRAQAKINIKRTAK